MLPADATRLHHQPDDREGSAADAQRDAWQSTHGEAISAIQERRRLQRTAVCAMPPLVDAEHEAVRAADGRHCRLEQLAVALAPPQRRAGGQLSAVGAQKGMRRFDIARWRTATVGADRRKQRAHRRAGDDQPDTQRRRECGGEGA